MDNDPPFEQLVPGVFLLQQATTCDLLVTFPRIVAVPFTHIIIIVIIITIIIYVIIFLLFCFFKALLLV
mgnify:CR=1 FL=1